LGTLLTDCRWCHSGLSREFDKITVLGTILAVVKKVCCRTTEVGARTLVWGATAGPESHGQYVPDCKIEETGGLAKGKAGAELQARVWAELKQKLERIKPGVTSL
jgi:hypothetical protein